VARARHGAPRPRITATMLCSKSRPADRWQSAAELVPQLDAMSTPSSGTMPVAAPVISTGNEQAIRRGHPVRVAALFVLASLVVLALVWTLVRRLGLPDWVLWAAIG